MNETIQPSKRRPLRSRDRAWARWLAGRLAASGVRPNAISIASLASAGVAGAARYYASLLGPRMGAALLLLAALCIQLRLLCNLLDGMVAIEGGRASKSGEVFNELPDRLADLAVLVPVGYATSQVFLGWSAGTLALLTAYVRALGVSAGARTDFCGPMAKPQRMAVMTVAALLAACEHLAGWPERSLVAALWIIVVGATITFLRRTSHVLRELESS